MGRGRWTSLRTKPGWRSTRWTRRLKRSSKSISWPRLIGIRFVTTIMRVFSTPAAACYSPRLMRRPAAFTLLLGALVLGSGTRAETGGTVAMLPAHPGPHWFWLSDILLHRTALFDADTGGLLGTITSGSGGVGFVITPLFSADHREIYLAETYYARGVRGERTDVVTVYDATTLQ